MKNTATRQLTAAALLLGCCLAAHLLESAFPPPFFFAPYLRLGISHIFVLLALVILGLPSALGIMLGKCLLSSLWSGVFSLYYSLPAGILSVLAMAAALRLLYAKAGLMSVSALGSGVFNAAQLIAFALLSRHSGGLALIPMAVLLSALTGAVTGLAAHYALRALPLKVLAGLSHNPSQPQS